MACPQCLEDQMEKFVNVRIQCPANTNKLDKTSIRRKEIQIISVDWDKASYYCIACGYFIWPGKKENG